jgi:hypothetical protein
MVGEKISQRQAKEVRNKKWRRSMGFISIEYTKSNIDAV